MPDPQESSDAEPSSEKELIVRPLEFCTLYTLFVSCYMHCLLNLLRCMAMCNIIESVCRLYPYLDMLGVL